MNSAQPQLLQIALDKKDVVYTPDWVAKDMVEFFKPSGRILEPACGDGAILKYLPGADWCEIEKGRDFFACQERYDWIISNPPFRQFFEFMLHGFSVAQDIVYFLPGDKPFNVYLTTKMIWERGGIVHARHYGDGRTIGIPEIHRTATAFHFQRGYTGPMYTSFYEGAG